ncbi:DDE-type integrase/transposase/recombinase [Streptomyces sp. NPDC058664]|uniref:DDE-type integrase/transposase/recombinase n=1 Tax=unclassified Streptomyces TaxID=2593676 RepID=UPI0036526486
MRRHHLPRHRRRLALPGHDDRHRLPARGWRVVGWATADHLRTELVADALTAACRTRRPARPVIFHFDRGCQDTSREIATLAVDFNVCLSVGRTGY